MFPRALLGSCRGAPAQTPPRFVASSILCSIAVCCVGMLFCVFFSLFVSGDLLNLCRVICFHVEISILFFFFSSFFSLSRYEHTLSVPFDRRRIIYVFTSSVSSPFFLLMGVGFSRRKTH